MGRICNPLPAALGVIRLALRPGRDGLAGLGQVGAGNARSTEGPPTFPPRPRKQKPGAESLAMKHSLGREPRWNADRCAPGAPGAAVPVGTAEYFIASVGVSPPNLFVR